MSRTVKLSSLFILLLAILIVAVPVMASGPDDNQAPKVDKRQDPLTDKQEKLLEKAMEAKLNGKAYGKTHEVAKGQYVELEREGEDPVWTVLGEFSDLAHNSIPQPNRAVDNSTIWTADFSSDYFNTLLYSNEPGVNSMRNFYIEQSSNRYTVYGDATDWVTVSGPAASYDDDLGGPAIWSFLDESVDGWYASQLAAGKSTADIDAYLSQFDTWDRYDWDEDGIFDEPDGYIDHIQFVHAGEGNEAGGGILGESAIWSHSWFAYFNLIGVAGPSDDFLEGGVQIGDSGYWLNKYTVQPENGGVGVFTHEYAHDLGLPDQYDYSGENSSGFWTLMSSGSWLSDGTQDIGSKPNHLNAWEKFQLGWLNYEVAYAGEKSEHKLGPAETNTKQAQGLFVVLPDKDVVSEIGVPYEGENFYYSGSGDDLDNIMYKAFDLPVGAQLTAQVDFEIELDWDYAYLVVSPDGGATWMYMPTNFSTTDDPNGQNFGNGITGSSNGWAELTADLSAFGGSNVLVGFRYWTDGAAVERGLMIDNIQVADGAIDGAEGDEGWTLDGFRVSTGTEAASFFNAYVAEFRQYRGYDQGLLNAYNFGWASDEEYYNWVEHFPYQDGLLISYWDTSFADNNVGDHCAAGSCGGLLLPIDAHPDVMMRPDGGMWRNRVQSYDSTFTLDPTDAITLHWYGVESPQPSLPGVSIFDDNNSYYRAENPMGSVITPQTGTQIRIKSISARDSFMQVQVRPSK